MRRGEWHGGGRRAIRCPAPSPSVYRFAQVRLRDGAISGRERGRVGEALTRGMGMGEEVSPGEAVGRREG